MDCYVSRKGYVVPKASLDAAGLDKLRRELTVRAHWDPDKSYGPPPPRFKVYLENERKVCVPTYYGLLRFGAAPCRFPGVVEAGLQFDGRLKEETRQVEAAEAALDACRRWGGGILALPTGFGKTAVALYVACMLGGRTLVVVHKQFLMDQWSERIATFVPGASVGRLQGNTMDTSKDFVLAMLQSLSMREYPEECYRGFKTVIIDVRPVSCLDLSGSPFCMD